MKPTFALKLLLAGSLLILPFAATSNELISFPAETDQKCRTGRAKIYDECTDQIALFKTALSRANSEGKTLLVSYGAEWCIWCHVFEAYIEGGKTRFDYGYATPDAPDKIYHSTLFEREANDVSEMAAKLQAYVASHFVIVNIDSRFAPNGTAVLDITDAYSQYNGGLPYIFTVDKTGEFAASLNPDRVESRRDTEDWYRGYDRTKLLLELQRLETSAKG